MTGLTLKLSVAFLLVFAILWQLGGLGEVGRLMARMEVFPVLLALLVATVDRALMVYKWSLLLRARGAHLTFLKGMKIYCASMVWGQFLPTGLGSDAIRIVSTSRAGIRSNEVVASIVVERFIGFLAMLFLGLVSLGLLYWLGALDSRFFSIWLAGSALLLLATLLFAASFNQRVFELIFGQLPDRIRENRIVQRLKDFHATYRLFQQNKVTLWTFSLLTFTEQFLPVIYVWLLARSFGLNVGLLSVTGASPLALLSSRLPITIDGWGVFEGTFILAMSLIGVSPAESLAIALAGRIVQTASWLPWWFAHVVSIGGIRPPGVLSVKT